MQTRYYTEIPKILEHTFYQLLATVNEEDTQAERKTKDFYRFCMTIPEKSQTYYRKRIMKIVNDILKMPALKGAAWKEDDFETSYKYGIQLILGYLIEEDNYDQSAHVLKLSYHDFNLESDPDELAYNL